MTDAETHRFPQSPCVGVCHIGEDGYCEGCLRTLGEIAAWGVLNEHERAAIFESLHERGRARYEVTAAQAGRVRQ